MAAVEPLFKREREKKEMAKLFQALRIEVNHEMDALKEMLRSATELLKPGGILSVLLQAWYDIEYLFTVPEHVFNPPPKVKSGVIRLVRNNVEHLDCDERLWKSVIKTSFGQRRKTLRNSLRGMVQNPDTLALPIFNKRPEQLSVDEFIYLTNLISKK